MKKLKNHEHGIYKFTKDCIKIMSKRIPLKCTNNYRKKHSKPMRRKYK